MCWTLGHGNREGRPPLLEHCGTEHILNNSRSSLGLPGRGDKRAVSHLSLSHAHSTGVCWRSLHVKLPLEEGWQESGRLDLKVKTEFPLFIGV